MIAERLTAQLLSGDPARDPLAVARRLLAIQAQDPAGARLAIRARTIDVTAADVDRALTVERSLVIGTLNRGTLHLVSSEDYPWLHALTTPQLYAGNARRLAQEGVSPTEAERGVDAIERALAREGPLVRSQLRERVRAANVPIDGQAFVHVVMLASLRGLIVRGPMIGSRHAFVLVRDWLGAQRPVDRDRALAELAGRYLAGHAPATERDLAKWAGLPLRDARAGLAALAAKLDVRDDGLLALRNAPPVAELPPPRLLGTFEPLLLGWTSREPILGDLTGAVVSGGIFRGFALVRGRAAGTWRRDGDRVELTSLANVGRADARALDEDAAAVIRFFAAGAGG